MKHNVGPREQLFRITVGSAALLGAMLIPKLRRWRWFLGGWGLANIHRIDALLPDQSTDRH